MRHFFEDSFVLVTGASSGIGEVFARELAENGANLVVTARSRDKLESLAVELEKKHGVKVHVVAADISEASGVDSLCHAVDELGERVDHVVNNAGFGIAGAFAKSDEAEQARMLRLNCEALMRITRHFLPAMLGRGAGGVIHVASTAAYQPMPYMATYGATKAFVLSFSVALREEVEGRGVRVMALCPGPVPTGFQAAAGIEPGMERIAALSAQETVRRGLEAYLDDQGVCVPGAVNRVQTLVSKFMPRSVVTSTISAAMKRMGRAK